MNHSPVFAESEKRFITRPPQPSGTGGSRQQTGGGYALLLPVYTACIGYKNTQGRCPMKITEGLKSLEQKIEHELTAFFLFLGESEMPEHCPLQQSDHGQPLTSKQPQPH